MRSLLLIVGLIYKESKMRYIEFLLLFLLLNIYFEKNLLNGYHTLLWIGLFTINFYQDGLRIR